MATDALHDGDGGEADPVGGGGGGGGGGGDGGGGDDEVDGHDAENEDASMPHFSMRHAVTVSRSASVSSESKMSTSPM